MKKIYNVRFRPENYDNDLRKAECHYVKQYYSNKSGGLFVIGLIASAGIGVKIFLDGITTLSITALLIAIIVVIAAGALQTITSGRIQYNFGLKSSETNMEGVPSLSPTEQNNVITEYIEFIKSESNGGFRSVDEYAFYFSGEPVTKRQNAYYGFLETTYYWLIYLGIFLGILYFLIRVYLVNNDSTNEQSMVLLVIAIASFVSGMMLMLVKISGKFIFLNNVTFKLSRKRKMYKSNIKNILDKTKNK